MRADLEDALVPVKWAEAQMPILRQRLIDWQHTNPYKIVAEPDPKRADRELLVAYLENTLDPLIIGDVGAMVNSIRTGLDLMMAEVVARHGVLPDRAPNFPIHKTPAQFLAAVDKLKSEYGISWVEAATIKRTKAYDGGDHVLWHIGKLDNLRKHQRLLTVETLSRRIVHRDRPGPRFREADDPHGRQNHPGQNTRRRTPPSQRQYQRDRRDIFKPGPGWGRRPRSFAGLESLHFPSQGADFRASRDCVRITVTNDVPSGPKAKKQCRRGRTYLAHSLSPMQLVAMEDGKAHNV